ncbi:hypothetical protein KFK09_011754 [Dendrobium nobile]|uniref:Uncharacterized protein n=1 Tax=Dendrobium nobile TaxID=94219 RepID=A0A8T3BFT3_DENNO|nr:hypothetical protein KFK09_011754 [Dendrobium nobile]
MAIPEHMSESHPIPHLTTFPKLLILLLQKIENTRKRINTTMGNIQTDRSNGGFLTDQQFF